MAVFIIARLCLSLLPRVSNLDPKDGLGPVLASWLGTFASSNPITIDGSDKLGKNNMKIVILLQ
jgi:hypothetical protein